MIDELYRRLGFSANCELGNRVYKKLFLENAELTASDKRAFTDDIELVTWAFKLAPDTISVPAFVDDQREYTEIAVLQVDIKSTKRVPRIAQVIHRAIPYPLVLVFQQPISDGACQVVISLAHKRFSQAEKEKIVADEFFSSGWMSLKDLSEAQQHFLDSLSINLLPQFNLFALYSAMVDRMIALECSHFTGSFRVNEAAESYADRASRLAECQALEQRLASLRKGIKQETQFNRQVELNVQIKSVRDQLQEKIAAL